MAKTRHPPVGINLNAISEGFTYFDEINRANIEVTARLHPEDQIGLRRDETGLELITRTIMDSFEDPEQEWLLEVFNYNVIQQFIDFYWMIPFYHSKADHKFYDIWSAGLKHHFNSVVEVLRQYPLQTVLTQYQFLYLSPDKGLMNQYGFLDTYCRKLKSGLAKTKVFSVSPNDRIIRCPDGEIFIAKDLPLERDPILLCHLLGITEGDKMRFNFQERGYKKLGDGSPDLTEIPKSLQSPDKSSVIDFLITLASGKYNDFLNSHLRKRLLVHLGKSDISVSHLETIQKFLELCIQKNYPCWPPAFDPDKIPFFKNESVATLSLKQFKDS